MAVQGPEVGDQVIQTRPLPLDPSAAAWNSAAILPGEVSSRAGLAWSRVRPALVALAQEQVHLHRPPGIHHRKHSRARHKLAQLAPAGRAEPVSTGLVPGTQGQHGQGIPGTVSILQHRRIPRGVDENASVYQGSGVAGNADGQGFENVGAADVARSRGRPVPGVPV